MNEGFLFQAFEFPGAKQTSRRLNPSRETKFSGTHGDRGIFILPVQLTTGRIGNLTRLIHTLLYVMTIHTYIELHTLDKRFVPVFEFPYGKTISNEIRTVQQQQCNFCGKLFEFQLNG